MYTYSKQFLFLIGAVILLAINIGSAALLEARSNPISAQESGLFTSALAPEPVEVVDPKVWQWLVLGAFTLIVTKIIRETNQQRVSYS